MIFIYLFIFFKIHYWVFKALWTPMQKGCLQQQDAAGEHTDVMLLRSTTNIT